MKTISSWRRAIFCGFVACLLERLCSPALAQGGVSVAPSPDVTVTPLAWLLPLGVTLAAMGLRRAIVAREAAVALPLALMLALAGYAASGFAFQFGSLGLVNPSPGLEDLTAQWAPFKQWLGEGWGLAGLRGFFFPLYVRSEAQRALFLSQLPFVVTATLIPLVALRGRIPALPQYFLALWVSAVAYPLMGHWLQTGGWLSRLGQTLSLGHGAVDASLSSFYLVGGLAALVGLVSFRGLGSEPQISEPPELPRAHLPLYLLIGSVLAWTGWLAHLQGIPLALEGSRVTTMQLNALWATMGTILMAALYGWLIHGEVDAGLVGRSLLVAMVAIGPGAPYLSWHGALLLGALCGLLLAPTIYIVERIWGCEDRGAAVSIFLWPATMGLLAVGLLSRGEVTGWWAGDPAVGLAQFLAQLLGLAALGVMAGLIPWSLVALMAQAHAIRQGKRNAPQELEETVSPPRPPQRTYAARTRSLAHSRRRIARPGDSAAFMRSVHRRHR